MANPGLVQKISWGEVNQVSILEDGSTFLHLSTVAGNEKEVMGLIASAPLPAVLDIQNCYGLTAMHLAVQTGNHSIVRLLLASGANPALFDYRGYTPLHTAVATCQVRCLDEMLRPIGIDELDYVFGILGKQRTSEWKCRQALVDVESKTYSGNRCVHLAFHPLVLKFLVQRGADINAQDYRRGLTPLHIAIEENDMRLVRCIATECLLVDFERTSYTGMTAFQYACLYRRSEICNLLQARGANPVMPPGGVARVMALDIDEYQSDSGVDSADEDSDCEFSDLDE